MACARLGLTLLPYIHIRPVLEVIDEPLAPVQVLTALFMQEAIETKVKDIVVRLGHQMDVGYTLGDGFNNEIMGLFFNC